MPVKVRVLKPHLNQTEDVVFGKRVENHYTDSITGLPGLNSLGKSQQHLKNMSSSHVADLLH